jgi:hypothetical protein
VAVPGRMKSSTVDALRLSLELGPSWLRLGGVLLPRSRNRTALIIRSSNIQKPSGKKTATRYGEMCLDFPAKCCRILRTWSSGLRSSDEDYGIEPELLSLHQTTLAAETSYTKAGMRLLASKSAG